MAGPPRGHLARPRARGGSQLCSLSTHTWVLWDHFYCTSRPVEQRGPVHKKVKVTQKGLWPRTLPFFDLSTFHKVQVSDDFRTWHSKENWREEQSLLGEMERKPTEGEVFECHSGQSPRAIYLLMCACLVGAGPAGAVSRENVPGGRGANPTPVLGNIQQVGLENVLRAKQSFPCGSYTFHTKRAKTEGSGCPNEPWAVHCMPIWSLTRLLQQLYPCMRTCFLSRGVRAKRNKMQKKEDILPTQLCSLYHPWSLRGAVFQQFGLLLAQRGWSLPSVSPGIPSLGEIPCPVWPMEAPGGDQRAGGQESVSVFWVCF